MYIGSVSMCCRAIHHVHGAACIADSLVSSHHAFQFAISWLVNDQCFFFGSYVPRAHAIINMQMKEKTRVIYCIISKPLQDWWA